MWVCRKHFFGLDTYQQNLISQGKNGFLCFLWIKKAILQVACILYSYYVLGKYISSLKKGYWFYWFVLLTISIYQFSMQTPQQSNIFYLFLCCSYYTGPWYQAMFAWWSYSRSHFLCYKWYVFMLKVSWDVFSVINDPIQICFILSMGEEALSFCLTNDIIVLFRSSFTSCWNY